MANYAPDIIQSLAELLKKRRAGRDAAMAAQLRANNAAELALNKPAKYWSPEAQALVWGTAQEAEGMPTEQPWNQQMVETVLPGAGGGEAIWSMKREDLPTSGYQTGKTTIDPTQAFESYMDEFGNERELTYQDKLNIYNEGGQLGDKGLVVAPPKQEVKTDANSGQQYYFNDYAGRTGQVTPDAETVQNIYNQTGILPEDIIKDYELNVPTVGNQQAALNLEQDKETDYGTMTKLDDGEGNLIMGFQTGNTFVDENKKPIIGAKPWEAPTKKSAPQWHMLSDGVNNISARYDVDENKYYNPMTNEELDTSNLKMVSKSLPKEQIIDSIFGDTRSGLRRRWESLDSGVTSAISVADPSNKGDMYLTSPYIKTAGGEGDSNLTDIGRRLFTSKILTLSELNSMKSLSPIENPAIFKKVIMATTGMTEGQYKMWWKYKKMIGTPESEAIKTNQSYDTWEWGPK